MLAIAVNIVHRDCWPEIWLDIWPDMRKVVRLPDSLWHLAGLEGGMESGRPSLALRLTLPDGEDLIAETSLGAWIAATAVLRGAFPEAFAGTPLE